MWYTLYMMANDEDVEGLHKLYRKAEATWERMPSVAATDIETLKEAIDSEITARTKQENFLQSDLEREIFIVCGFYRLVTDRETINDREYLNKLLKAFEESECTNEVKEKARKCFKSLEIE